ncbi:MAG: ferritin [candidate division Zixibacteria bacterium]
MISEKIQKAINDQINAEFYSSYLYLSMAAYFEAENYKGFATWMRIQAEEEKEHAYKLYDFVNDRGGRVVLAAIEAPPANFKSVQDVYEKTLAHEREVTARINKLNSLALEENDYATTAHLQWFITEQVEEEATAEDILNQIKMVEGKADSLFYIDKHMAKRQGETADESQ